MSDPVFGDAEIEYPVQVHYRVIAEARDAVRQAVLATAATLGVTDNLTDGHASAGGKYQTYNLSVVVDNHQRMQEIDQAFRAVPGVKMVL